jgi:hypothetical protein
VQVNALFCDITEDLHAPGIRSDRFPGASRASPTETRDMIRCYVEVFWRRFVRRVHGSAPSLSIDTLLASNSAVSRAWFHRPEGVERARLVPDRLITAFELQPHAVPKHALGEAEKARVALKKDKGKRCIEAVQPG